VSALRSVEQACGSALIRVKTFQSRDLHVSRELDMPMPSQSVFRERLQNSNKQEEIEIYYELLSSGHSVGEILSSLGHLQSKSEHGDTATAEHPSSGFGEVATDVTSEAALLGVPQATTRCTPSLNVPRDAESCRTAKPRATKNAPLNELGADDWEQAFRESLPRSESNIVSSAGAHASASPEVAIRSDDQEPLQPRKFTNIAKWVAFGSLSTAAVISVYTAGMVSVYTEAVDSVSNTSFSIIGGGHGIEPATAHVQSDISSGTEAIAILPSASGHSEAADEDPKRKKQVVNADTSLAMAAEAEYRLEGNRSVVRAANLGETTRAKQPNVALPPTREMAAAAPAPRTAEKRRQASDGAPMSDAEKDALFRQFLAWQSGHGRY
jgi:hypothetical protein